MLAIAIQCLVVQTHVDFSAWARPTTAAYAIGAPIQPTAGVDTHQGDGRAPNACLICQEVALAGGAVLGAATAVTPNAGGQIEAIFVASAPVLEARRSHAWRSRAPPSRA